MKKIVFASNNKGKLAEMREIMSGRFTVLSLEDIGCHDDIAETGNTLEANALIKARHVKEKYGYDCFADDTGLFVDALGGEPGIRSARYASDRCDSDENINLLLSRLEGKKQRDAHFSTVVALILGDKEICFEGRVEGVILENRSGNGGFGYDPVFAPIETGRSFASMTDDEKNHISHRGRAVCKLIEYLDSLA